MKHITTTYLKKPNVCNCMNVRRASRAITQFYDEVLKPSGLTVAQMALLGHLVVMDEITITDLAKRMRIDRTTLNRNMKPLIEGDLITVKTGKDTRTRQIHITECGKIAVNQARGLWKEAQASIKEYLGEEDLQKLTQLLVKLEALAP